MPLEAGKIVVGKVLDVTDKGLVVSLSEEDRGVVPVSEGLPVEAIQCFQPGGQIRVRVVVADKLGSYILAIEEKPSDSRLSKFDQEFNELNYVLTNHTPHVKGQKVTVEQPSIEERMEAWISKAEEVLSKLRKNRAKRLSEEFYNNKS
jgi:predicted RNA-binding protein with RPS1 domain